jgi:D-arabinose 1-dehydrogenase-like Zn-dependent alcohol dehydrogenase
VKPESVALELVGIAVEATQISGAGAGALVGRVDDATEGSAVLLGKRVLVGPLDPCGQCEVCRRGGAAVCPSAVRRSGEHVPRVRVSSRWVVALADGLDLPSPAAAAVAGDVTIAYTLYARTGLGPREPVVVLGANAVARFLVQVLRAKGITPVVLDETGDLDADRTRVHAALAADGLGAKPWRLLVTDPAQLPRAAALAGPRATITVLAAGALPALPADVLAREVTVLGVAGPHPDLVVEAAALCAKGEIDLAAGVVSAPATAPTCTTIAS